MRIRDTSWLCRVGSQLAPALALAGAFAFHVEASAADEWPSQPVTIVAPYAPGGTADTLGRVIAQKLSGKLKQKFVVENRAGAGGIVGSAAVAKAPPDGYTLVVSGIGSHVIAPAVSSAPYDPVNSFTHIALFGGPPIALVVNPDFKATKLDEFIAVTRSNPEGIPFGSPGKGTHGHLIGEMFAAKTTSKLIHVPYKGAALAIADLIANHVPVGFMTLSTASGQIKAGKARALAVTSAKRLADYADVPTFAESGFTDLVAITWFGLSGPAGMPAEVVHRLNAEVRAIMHEPDVRERVQVEGIEPNDLDAKAFTEFIRAEIKRWTPYAKSAKE